MKRDDNTNEKELKTETETLIKKYADGDDSNDEDATTETTTMYGDDSNDVDGDKH